MMRIWVVFATLLFSFLCIILRLFYWQILTGEELRRAAAAQYYYEFTIPAQRGEIVTSDGSPLVMNAPSYLVFAQPNLIKDKLKFLDAVSRHLPINVSSLSASLLEEGRMWLPLKRKVDNEIVEKLKSEELDGLGFEKDPKRYYAEASMAAHLLGFVGFDQNGRDKGYFGLEGFYDRDLRGKDGHVQIEKDVRGAAILIGQAKRIEATDGRTLVLWLDRTIQHIAEKRLLEGIEKYGASEGTVTIMDPKTGGILAMASYPNYDPSVFGEFDSVYYKNPVVASSYEPGSTFKVLVMAEGIEHGGITPDMTIEETGPVRVGEYSIRTWDNKYHGTITMTEVLERSSNVGMVAVAKALGQEKMLTFFRAYGFGDSTGVDLEEESSPAIRPDSEWKEIDFATASFGQGIAVTPLQMVRAVSAIANNGWLMEPRIVKEIKEPGGKTVHVKSKKIRQVMSDTTSRLITEMMVAAVEYGEAKWAKPKGYRIAGKTGTAQIPVEGHYDEKKTIASFVGFAPADNPEFVMLVTLREPKSSPWGSETAAPLFFRIARDIFGYLGMPPS